MRQFTETETRNIKLLTAKSIKHVLLNPTENGLKKGIIDAPLALQEYLKQSGLHDYNQQGQGQENKATIQATFLNPQKTIDSIASLYRPQTKHGDPRIWFSGLPKYSNAGDLLAVTIAIQKLVVINISTFNAEEILSKDILKQALSLDKDLQESAAGELLSKLRTLAKRGAIPAKSHGDKAIGYTLRASLGIETEEEANLNYRGIEIRAFRSTRSRRQNRKSLFSQVPDWGLSMFKSSDDILKNLGYKRENEDLRLFCTVNTLNKNSQGLILKMDNQAEWLIENSDNPKIGDFAIWWLSDLRQKLLNKHRETFWVSANTIIKDGKEYFEYNKVLHTKAPLETQFDMLLEQGKISLDHTISRRNGSTRDHGYIFRIEHDALDLLFPEAEEYDLLAA